MPCNINVICFIDQYSETSNFANAVWHQNINTYINIIAFYPKYPIKDSDLEKFNKGDIVKIQGKFSIIKTEVN